MRTCVVSWTNDLGNPTQPGTVRVRGVGEVNIRQENIDTARGLGGRVDVELIDVTNQDSGPLPEFIIRNFLPA